MKKLRMELEISKFNDVYMLKQNPTYTRRDFMSTKQDKGINIVPFSIKF